MLLFKIIYGLDVITALVIFYFFIVGIGDGSVSIDNIGLWLIIIASLSGILWGSLWLKSHNYFGLAYTVLLLLAIPALFYILYILFAILCNPRWN